MARPKTHKISVQVKGLSHEQAARLYYIISCAAYSFVGTDASRYDTASNVPLSVLRAEFPDEDWRGVSAAERVALVK